VPRGGRAVAGCRAEDVLEEGYHVREEGVTFVASARNRLCIELRPVPVALTGPADGSLAIHLEPLRRLKVLLDDIM
jgi:hypothetical protein